MSIPRVSFIYAYPLDRGRRKYYEDNNLGEYPTTKEVGDTIEHWKNLWAELDETYKIVEKLSEVSGRVPERNLECFVFGGDLNAMSTPFLMPVLNKKGERRSDEMFIQTMIHELLHIFVTTNTKRYWGEVQSIYAEEEAICQNHIIVYAMLYEVYQQLFNKEPIDFSRDNLSLGYLRAIELVKQHGHTKLIDEYRSLTQ
jgi:hypothetical protein